MGNEHNQNGGGACLRGLVNPEALQAPVETREQAEQLLTDLNIENFSDLKVNYKDKEMDLAGAMVACEHVGRALVSKVVAVKEDGIEEGWTQEKIETKAMKSLYRELGSIASASNGSEMLDQLKNPNPDLFSQNPKKKLN